MKNQNVILETINISKSFGTVKALDQVSIQVRSGEIQGLIGENGSGKSTLSSIIYGIQEPSSGHMQYLGKPYAPKSPIDARENNISMIVQEKDTIDNLSIAENIFLGEEQQFSKGLIIDRAKMSREAKKALELVGMQDLDVSMPIYKLNFENRKLIEIAKALYYNPQLIIVDETTTALSQEGRLRIYHIMKQLRNEGKAVLFISHDLPEMMDICDSLTVLRDGQFMRTIDKEEFSEDLIKKTMVGRTIDKNLYRSDYEGRLTDDVIVQLDHVSDDLLQDVSFNLHKGEILGIGGLSGSGMHEIGRVIAGIREKTSGSVSILSEELQGIHHAMELKIGYISKDRDNETLILNESIKDNLTISAWDLIKRWKFFILPKDEKKFAQEQIEELNIKCTDENQLVRELSGGNKQKISFGKIIGNQSKILVLDSPTRGVDIGVKTTMYDLIHRLKHQGYAILIISEELPELLGMCDRIHIMKHGKLTKTFDRDSSLRDIDVINYMI